MFTANPNPERTVAVCGPTPSSPSWADAVAVITFRPNLRKTAAIALLIGTIFFCANQLGAVLDGQVTLALVLKAALAYVVPFCVSNYGILAARRAAIHPLDHGG